MGQPIDAKDINGGVCSLLQKARMEIGSAASALHMQPTAIPPSKQQKDNRGFLSDADYWVQHSVEHLHAVSLLLNKIESVLEAHRDSFLQEPFDVEAYERINTLLGRQG